MSNSNGNPEPPLGLVGLYFHSFNGEVIDGAGQVRGDLGDGWYLLARVERCWGESDRFGRFDDEAPGQIDLSELENAHLAVEHLEEMSAMAWRFYASREALEQFLNANQAAQEAEERGRRRHAAQRRPRGSTMHEN
jgi:hypothetical protein